MGRGLNAYRGHAAAAKTIFLLLPGTRCQADGQDGHRRQQGHFAFFHITMVLNGRLATCRTLTANVAKKSFPHSLQAHLFGLGEIRGVDYHHGVGAYGVGGRWRGCGCVCHEHDPVSPYRHAFHVYDRGPVSLWQGYVDNGLGGEIYIRGGGGHGHGHSQRAVALCGGTHHERDGVYVIADEIAIASAETDRM